MVTDSKNTKILTHADCDGICAGAVALSKFPGSDVFFTKPVSLYSDLKDVEEDRIVICDIALNKPDAPKIVELFQDKEVLYFDHHIVPKTVSEPQIKKASEYVHEENVSASELIYRYYQNDIPPERVWPAIYGAIGDYCDNTPFIQKRIKKWDRRAMFFQVSTLVLGIKNERYHKYDAKRRIVSRLSRGGNPSDMDGLVDSARRAVSREFQLYAEVKDRAKSRGKVAFVKDLHFFGFRGASALFSANVQNKRIGLSVYTRKNHLDITMRGIDNEAPLNILAEMAAEKVGGSGGGHPSAAGARISKGRFDEFLKEMNGVLKKYTGT